MKNLRKKTQDLKSLLFKGNKKKKRKGGYWRRKKKLNVQKKQRN